MRTSYLASLLCALPLAVLATSKHKHVSLVVSQQTIFADGNPSANAYVINGSFPAPTLRFKVGDVLTVNITNSLSSHNTTIHWHGLSQRNTPWCDGVPAVTQWAIAPGRWFACTFKLEETANTFYHTHVGLQAMTAHGAFIVDEADGKPTFDYDDDRVLEIGDYWHQSIDSIAFGLLNETFKWPGSASALLINGKAPLVSCNETLAQMQNVSCSNAPANSGLPEVVKIDYKQKLRLRYIGTGSLMHQKIGIFNHTQALIEVDGTYIDPLNVTDVEILPGQRYSTRIVGKSKKQVAADGTSGCYWVRQESRWRNPSANSWAILAYPNCNVEQLLATKPLATPIPVGSNTTLLSAAKPGWITDQMKPLFNNAKTRVPGDEEVTRRVYINTQQIPAGPSGKASRWANNAHVYSEEGSAFERPTTDVPYLIQLYTKQAAAPSYARAVTTNGYDNQTSVFVAKAGEVIDIVIINNGSQTGKQVEIHPWHNHGIKMHTLASGTGNFSDEALKEARSKGYHTPIPRDTHIVYPTPGETISDPKVLLPDNSSGGWTVLRHLITEQDAGVWLLHCHIHFHAIMGMNTVWSQDSDRTMNAMAVSSLSNNSAYLTFGNNVKIPLPH